VNDSETGCAVAVAQFPPAFAVAVYDFQVEASVQYQV